MGQPQIQALGVAPLVFVVGTIKMRGAAPHVVVVVVVGTWKGVAPWGWRHPCCWYHKDGVAPLVVVGTWGWVGAMRGSRT